MRATALRIGPRTPQRLENGRPHMGAVGPCAVNHQLARNRTTLAAASQSRQASHPAQGAPAAAAAKMLPNELLRESFRPLPYALLSRAMGSPGQKGSRATSRYDVGRRAR